MIYSHAVPEDLRTVDPRQTAGWDDEKASRVTAVKLELRFGPASLVAQMLGLAPSPARVKRLCRVCGVRVVKAAGRCHHCIEAGATA